MKIKKLISSALVFVMLFTTLAIFPISSSAAEASPEISVKEYEEVEGDFVKAVVDDYRLYGSKFTNKDKEVIEPFKNAREALDYEISKGYIDYVKYSNAAVYVNRYTGLMYYENTLTGQILTSNPYDPAYQTREGGQHVSIGDEMLSQIQLEYFEVANTSNKGDFNTIYWIYENGISPVITPIENGIAVEYIIGSAVEAFVAPGAMLYESMLEIILRPMFSGLATLLQSKCGDYDDKYDTSNKLTSYETEAQLEPIEGASCENLYSMSELKKVIDAYSAYAKAYDDANKTESFAAVSNFAGQIKIFLNQYKFVDPIDFGDNAALGDTITAFKEGKVISVLKGADTGDPTLTTIRLVDKAIKTTCPSFTSDKVEVYETECGYLAIDIDVPCFEVTLKYTIDDNGDLLVSVPANLIEYPREFCALKNIAPLKHFGIGDMDEDGYVFFPDGSGAVVEFDDFYYGSTSDKTNIAITLGEGIPMYGSDYCYANVSGQHREQLVMPVYGVVNEADSTGNGYSADIDTVKNGFFAVIEEGSSLASLTYLSGGGMHKYISVYASYAPFPTDTYDLSQSISVSGLGSYTLASKAAYSGSMTTRYSMLVDHDVYAKAVASDSEFTGYVADYVGMATCYREYLERNGVIELLKDDEILADLPLYVEALGSIDITKKILSFPVTVSESLTSFDDVKKMYDELSDAIVTLEKRADDCDAEVKEILAGEYPELHQDEINRLTALSEKYRALAKRVVKIKNVNFKLTGFANGGMASTYPAKLKWEKSVGGKKGFELLLEKAASVSALADQNLGIYPDFDFMYINNTAAFDGVGRRGTAACMVDNRYASKQEYNSVNQKFEKLFALLVSSDEMDSLYTKFLKDYSKFEAEGLGVSSMTSDLNSNFNEKNPIVREQSMNDITALLSKMASKYELLGEKGNIYSVEFLDHILSAPIDSSHYNCISYTVPFYGMVLHGYVNYTGSPLNYSGSPEYEILRSIENGAALYYILCMENTNYLKADPELSKYYGVDYNSWFEKIVEQYTILNGAIGTLQNHRIVSHTKVLAERVISDEQLGANYQRLIEEFAEVLDEKISLNIDIAIKNMREEGKIGAGLKFDVSDADIEAILSSFADRVNLSVNTLCEKYGLDDTINAVIDSYRAEYAEGEVSVTVKSDDVSEYKSKYTYITNSDMLADDYVYTDFTCDNGNVVMVTYEREVNGNREKVYFLLNYNVFSVRIKLSDEIYEKFADQCDADGYITLDKYEYKKG